MDSLQNLKLSNIESLHNSIDATNRTGIEQKGELVKDLNTKKQSLINAIQEELRTCRNMERTIYSQWRNMNNSDVYNRLEEFNVYLKGQHDRGSELIANINAAKNFQQLNQVELSQVNSFLDSLRSRCGAFSQDLPSVPVGPVYPIYTQYDPRYPQYGSPVYYRSPNPVYAPVNSASYATDVQTTGTGRTDIDVHHTGMGTDVNVSKEEAYGSPAHNVHISGAQGPVKVTHSPSPVRQTPVYIPPPVQPVQTFTPVQTVQQVTPVQPVRVVTPVQPVRVVTPVQPVRVVQPVTPVRVVTPVQPVQPVRVVQQIQPVTTVQTVSPVMVRSINTGTRAVVTHNYIPRVQDGTKLSLAAGTPVTIESYRGDWALVTTSAGQRGYISRHYLRMY